MTPQVFRVSDLGWIGRKLFRNGRVASEKLPEAVHVLAPHATIHGVFLLIVAVFLTHKGIGIFGELLADALMLLQVSLQSRVVFHELLVVYERRVAAELLG